MSINYGSLPLREVCEKLSMVSFSTPQKNLNVYRFCASLFQHHDFIGNECRKILEKYGEELSPDRTKAINELLSLEVNDDIPDHGLTEDDFLEGNCEYSKNRAFWLSANEIMTILNFSKKLKQEKTPDAE